MCIYSKSPEMLKQLNEIEAEAAVRKENSTSAMSNLDTIMLYWPVLLKLIDLWIVLRKVFFWKRYYSDVPEELKEAGNELHSVHKFYNGQRLRD